MHRAKSLRTLRAALRRRLNRLEQRLKATASMNNSDRDMTVAYVAIEALNAWSLFARSFYLSCAIGAKTERKKYITLTAPPTTDHLGVAITHYKKNATPNTAGQWHRRDEPAWHDPNVVMTVCANVGCSIQAGIEASFSLKQNVFNDLPVFRNFFAHRNEGTSRAASNITVRYALPSSLPPSEALLAVSPGTATPIMLDWLDELNITAEFICKG
jgi:hypothetical protein